MMKFILALVVAVVMTGTVAGFRILSSEVHAFYDAFYKLYQREIGYVLLSSNSSSPWSIPDFYVEEEGPWGFWGPSLANIRKKLTNGVTRFVVFDNDLCSYKGSFEMFAFAWVGPNTPASEKMTVSRSLDYLKSSLGVNNAGYYSDLADIDFSHMCTMIEV